MEATLNGDTVLYLYGFVPSAVDVSGVPAVEQGSEAFLVRHDEIACAASAVPPAAYRRPPEESTPAEQLEWVTPRAWRHHEVVRRLHHAAAVVPLKFGTLCPGVGEASALLRDHYDSIRGLLAGFRGKDEWTVHAAIDEAALAAAIERDDPQLAALREEEARLPEGRAYFARKKLQGLRTDRVRARRQTIEHAVGARLSELGVEAIAPECTGGSFALLVERARFVELEATLAELEAAHAASYVRFELVGPWPPYSFTGTLEAT